MKQLTLDSAPVAKLPTYAIDSFIQLRSEGDSQWKLTARILERVFEEGAKQNRSVPKMKLYQDAAAYLGQKTSTVRNWHGIYKAVPDELIDEYAGIFTFSHWRAMVPAAKRVGKSIEAYAEQLAATADDYAGMPIPVDVIVAKAASAEKTPAELFSDSLDAVRADLAIMSRHVNGLYPNLRPDLLMLMSAAEDFAAKVEQQKRTNWSGSQKASQ